MIVASLVRFGLLDHPQPLDRLFLLGDGLVDRDALTDDLGDLALLLLDLFVLGDALQLGLALAVDHLEHAVFLDPLGLDRHHPLAVLARDLDLALLLLFLDAEVFVRLDPRGLGLEPFLGLDLERLGLLAGPHRVDLALLLGLGIGLLAIELEDCLDGFDVLLFDLLLFGVLEFVGLDVLDGGELGDLADALGVEDVELVERAHRGLLEVVEGAVLERVAVQVGADDRQDAVAEFFALGVEIDEIQLLAGGLQGL